MTTVGIGDGVPPHRPSDELADAIVGRRTDDQRLLIALDHDGTISPIARRPDDAVLSPGAAEALTALGHRADVVILSGRGLDDLVARVGDLPVRIVSEHGLRSRDRDGRVTPLTEPIDAAVLDDVRAQLAGILTPSRLAEGWLVEDKGVGIAVHHRLVEPERLAATLDAVRDVLAAASGGQVQEGKAVVELRARGADKGSALAHLIAVSDGALPVMIGDDRTDEPALRAAERAGGVGVLVDRGGRPSSASVRVGGPDEVVLLLDALARLLTPGR